MIGQARDQPDVLRAAAAYLEAGADHRPAAEGCKLRIIDSEPAGRPPRTVRFGTAVTVRIDDCLVHLAQGETKTVVSPSGDYEVVPPPEPRTAP